MQPLGMRGQRRRCWARRACALVVALVAMLACTGVAWAEETAPIPVYQTLDELAGKRFAYVNGSVYNQRIQALLDGTTEEFYASLPDCVAAVEAGKVDAAVQLSYCCQIVVNRKGGTVALLPEHVAEVEEAFFFPHGDPLIAQFDEVIERFEKDGTIDALMEKWSATDESQKTLPEQDWDAPNGTLRFATTGVIEPFSYVRGDGTVVGYDVELALLIARELGYHLDISAISMDAIFASIESGKVDFGGTVTNTPERAEKVDFSRAVMPCYISVIVAADPSSATGASDGFFTGLATSFRRTFVDEGRWELVLSGLCTTVLISIGAGILGLVLGYGIVLARRSGNAALVTLVDGFQALMGGIPIVVVLMVLYYVVFGSMNVAGELVAILAFGLSFGSAAGSTMWTSVQGIDDIQEETGLALGYERGAVFSKIIFPQALHRFAPQLMGQFVSLLKETAVVGYIAVQDLTRAGDLIRSRTMEAMFPLVSTAIIYFVICRLLMLVMARIASAMDMEQRSRAIGGVEQ